MSGVRIPPDAPFKTEYFYIMTYITVDIDLSDFDDEDLIEELESRDYSVNPDASGEASHHVMGIYLLRRLGLPYDHLVDKMIYDIIGKVI